MDGEPGQPPGAAEQLGVLRAQLRSEIGFLHERVNALVAAEAFLTIAFTTAMANAAPWGVVFAAVVSPVLAVLGLALALLSWPGVRATVRLVLGLTRQHLQVGQREPGLAVASTTSDGPGATARQAVRDQRASMLFFRAVPPLFTVVWSVLLVVSMVLPR